MKKLLRRLIAVMLMLGLLGTVPSAVASGAMQAIGFAVHAALPENQRDTTGYFDLLMTPGRVQQLEVTVSNEMQAPLTVTVEINNAASNQNGLIVYSQVETRDDTLVTALTDIAAFRTDILTVGPEHSIQALEGNQLTIAPGATVSLPIEITMPDASIEGQILGGIVVSKVNPDTGEQTSSMQINSVYSYAIAVQLQEEEVTSLSPDFSLLSAELTNVAGWKAVMVNLHNPLPLVVTGAQIRVWIVSSDGSLLMDHESQRVAMAPNSVLPYTVTLDPETIPGPGEYTVQVDWTYEGKTWNFETALVVPDTAT